MLLAVTLSTSYKRMFNSIASCALSSETTKIGVIGGGASGIFAAISAAESAALQKSKRFEVIVLEATSNTLQKVKISGGGRCNVLHDTSKPVPTILAGYPRGQRELNGMYYKRFTPAMAQEWFVNRGVELKVESDGRMFPITDSSQTIMDTLMTSAERAGVDVRLRRKVKNVEKLQDDNCFKVHYNDESTEIFDRIILATGSSPAGYALANELGHDPIKPMPSLFTLNCHQAVSEGGVLHGLSGISVPAAHVTLKFPAVPSSTTQDDDPNEAMKPKKRQNRKSKTLTQDGPLLVTHHGVSGPAVLRLSAFGARDFSDIKYRGQLIINWDPSALGTNVEDLLDQLWQFTASHPKRTVASVCPLPGNSIPRRLWSSLVQSSGFPPDATWGNVPKKLVRQLATNLISFPLEFSGKGTFKDEFVTAGGISLKEIDMKTMESKICPGLFLCGEVIDVDGITGGYNFMNCWSTGYVAGESTTKME
jgi:predicted flavoprotein YhiN